MQTTIHPTFNKRLRIIRMMLITCLFPAIPGLFYGFATVGFGLSGLQALTCLAIFLFLINSLWLFGSKQYYKMSSFEIEDDSITGRSDFISTIVKRINFENIKEIEFRVGPLQRFFGLGDIAISTQASSSGGNEFSGMTLFDIKNVEDIYNLIKKNIRQ